MELILYTREEMEETLSHGAILCTQEWADDYLMHWRTKGSKNGVRRYQDESGRLTPEGYQHYAEMYGWNKQLNKISRIQDKADRLTNKAAKADMKAAKAKVKSDKAERDANAITRRAILNPGQSRNSEMDNAVLNVARMENLKYQNRQNKADSIHAKANRANLEAVKLADKLQKKEDKLSKYIDENGMLNEKALEKYTYATGVPGERKMSLVGRIKFGNEYSNKFEKDFKEKETKRLQEMSQDLVSRTEKQINLYENEKDPAKRIAGLNAIHGELESIHSGEFTVDSSKQKELEKWYDEATTKEKQGIVDLVNKVPEYKSMSGKELEDLGTRMLNELNASDKDYRRSDPDYSQLSKYLQSELIDMVHEKSGSINAGDYKPGTHAAKAQEEENAVLQKQYARENQIRSDIGYENDKTHGSKYKAEEKRLVNALEKDSVWKELNQEFQKKGNDVMGAILQDLGFADTPQNRSILWVYGWWD